MATNKQMSVCQYEDVLALIVEYS